MGSAASAGLGDETSHDERDITIRICGSDKFGVIRPNGTELASEFRNAPLKVNYSLESLHVGLRVYRFLRLELYFAVCYSKK